ncbi:MAG: sigma-70 family RNA polymerase sigma factor [Pseudomonadota bacterium]
MKTPAQNDQIVAVAAFVEEREALIYTAARIVESRAVAEEIVQESWLRWKQKDYSAADARPVFRRIVSNLALDWVRRRRNETLILRQTTQYEQDCRDAERIIIAREDVAQMVVALSTLPPRTVTAFRMSRLEGKTYAEIARHLDTVPSRVHGYVTRALATIAVVLMD